MPGLDQPGARRSEPLQAPLKPFGQRVGAHEMGAWTVVPAQERPQRERIGAAGGEQFVDLVDRDKCAVLDALVSLWAWGWRL